MSYKDQLSNLDMQDRKRQTKSQEKKISEPAPDNKKKPSSWSGFWKKDRQEVKITGISIPFFDLVFLLVELAIAAIPATIIVAIIWYLVAEMIFGGPT